MKISTPELAAALATQLAECDDREQATFFNTFFKELNLTCKGDGDSQIFYIARHLNPVGREGIRNFQRNLDLREEMERKEKEGAN